MISAGSFQPEIKFRWCRTVGCRAPEVWLVLTSVTGTRVCLTWQPHLGWYEATPTPIPCGLHTGFILIKDKVRDAISGSLQVRERDYKVDPFHIVPHKFAVELFLQSDQTSPFWSDVPELRLRYLSSDHLERLVGSTHKDSHPYHQFGTLGGRKWVSSTSLIYTGDEGKEEGASSSIQKNFARSDGKTRVLPRSLTRGRSHSQLRASSTSFNNLKDQKEASISSPNLSRAFQVAVDLSHASSKFLAGLSSTSSGVCLGFEDGSEPPSPDNKETPNNISPYAAGGETSQDSEDAGEGARRKKSLFSSRDRSLRIEDLTGEEAWRCRREAGAKGFDGSNASSTSYEDLLANISSTRRATFKTELNLLRFDTLAQERLVKEILAPSDSDFEDEEGACEVSDSDIAGNYGCVITFESRSSSMDDVGSPRALEEVLVSLTSNDSHPEVVFEPSKLQLHSSDEEHDSEFNLGTSSSSERRQPEPKPRTAIPRSCSGPSSLINKVPVPSPPRLNVSLVSETLVSVESHNEGFDSSLDSSQVHVKGPPEGDQAMSDEDISESEARHRVTLQGDGTVTVAALTSDSRITPDIAEDDNFQYESLKHEDEHIPIDIRNIDSEDSTEGVACKYGVRYDVAEDEACSSAESDKDESERSNLHELDRAESITSSVDREIPTDSFSAIPLEDSLKVTVREADLTGTKSDEDKDNESDSRDPNSDPSEQCDVPKSCDHPKSLLNYSEYISVMSKSTEIQSGSESVEATSGVVSATASTLAGDDRARTLMGDDRARTLTGDDRARTVTGDDRARTLMGDDRARTLTGDDRASTLTGDDRARTLTGDDRARTSTGDDRARTVTGDDRARTLTGDDRARTSTGDDRARTVTGDDRARTCTGDDRARTSTGDDRARTVTGDDRARTVTGDDRARTLTGDDRARTLTGDDRARTLTGDDRARTLTGDDRARTLTGDDRARTLTGDDRARTSTGDDRARTVTGDDRARTVTGDDRARTLTGDDRARTLTGDDRARTLTGDDRARTLTGDDRARTLTGDDRARTLTGDDRARTLTGDDRARTLTGDDRARTLTGDDRARTLTGDDRARTLTGDDRARTLTGDDHGRNRSSIDDNRDRISRRNARSKTYNVSDRSKTLTNRTFDDRTFESDDRGRTLDSRTYKSGDTNRTLDSRTYKSGDTNRTLDSRTHKSDDRDRHFYGRTYKGGDKGRLLYGGAHTDVGKNRGVIGDERGVSFADVGKTSAGSDVSRYETNGSFLSGQYGGDKKLRASVGGRRQGQHPPGSATSDQHPERDAESHQPHLRYVRLQNAGTQTTQTKRTSKMASSWTYKFNEGEGVTVGSAAKYSRSPLRNGQTEPPFTPLPDRLSGPWSQRLARGPSPSPANADLAALQRNLYNLVQGHENTMYLRQLQNGLRHKAYLAPHLSQHIHPGSVQDPPPRRQQSSVNPPHHHESPVKHHCHHPPVPNYHQSPVHQSATPIHYKYPVLNSTFVQSSSSLAYFTTRPHLGARDGPPPGDRAAGVSYGGSARDLTRLHHTNTFFHHRAGGSSIRSAASLPDLQHPVSSHLRVPSQSSSFSHTNPGPTHAHSAFDVMVGSGSSVGLKGLYWDESDSGGSTDSLIDEAEHITTTPLDPNIYNIYPRIHDWDMPNRKHHKQRRRRTRSHQGGFSAWRSEADSASVGTSSGRPYLPYRGDQLSPGQQVKVLAPGGGVAVARVLTNQKSSWQINDKIHHTSAPVSSASVTVILLSEPNRLQGSVVTVPLEKVLLAWPRI
nr:uncharacterized protein LOC123758303 isoform X2 [Procambarus clarkii]